MSRENALRAVKTLLKHAGDDPSREGLVGTPERVVKAYGEWFSGYGLDPKEVLSRTFKDSGGYNEVVMLKDIRFESHCEHHMVPILGLAHVAYLPNKRVVGISKLARVVEIYAKRLQIQEKMTAQIADTIYVTLEPRGVAVIIEAEHLCMTTRGIRKPGVTMTTSAMRGAFIEDAKVRTEILQLLGG